MGDWGSGPRGMTRVCHAAVCSCMVHAGGEMQMLVLCRGLIAL
jgi:hypothetical protein